MSIACVQEAQADVFLMVSVEMRLICLISLTFQAEERGPASKEVSAVIESLKKKLAANRCISIKVNIGYC